MGTSNIDVRDITLPLIRQCPADADIDNPIVLWDQTIPGFHVMLGREFVTRFDENGQAPKATEVPSVEFFLECWDAGITFDQRRVIPLWPDTDGPDVDRNADPPLEDIRRMAVDEIAAIYHETRRRRRWQGEVQDRSPMSPALRALLVSQEKNLDAK
jgi:hypothetical protein